MSRKEEPRTLYDSRKEARAMKAAKTIRTDHIPLDSIAYIENHKKFEKYYEPYGGFDTEKFYDMFPKDSRWRAKIKGRPTYTDRGAYAAAGLGRGVRYQLKFHKENADVLHRYNEKLREKWREDNPGTEPPDLPEPVKHPDEDKTRKPRGPKRPLKRSDSVESLTIERPEIKTTEKAVKAHLPARNIQDDRTLNELAERVVANSEPLSQIDKEFFTQMERDLNKYREENKDWDQLLKKIQQENPKYYDYLINKITRRMYSIFNLFNNNTGDRFKNVNLMRLYHGRIQAKEKQLKDALGEILGAIDDERQEVKDRNAVEQAQTTNPTKAKITTTQKHQIPEANSIFNPVFARGPSFLHKLTFRANNMQQKTQLGDNFRKLQV